MGAARTDKTNAARLLDKAGVAYELIPYSVDEDHLSAADVAAQLGEDVECVFKTLVLKADLIPMKELWPVTGYVRGGCSPVGMKKSFPTFIHSSVSEHRSIYISAGMRGLQLRLSPSDLIGYVHAVCGDISRKV